MTYIFHRLTRLSVDLQLQFAPPLIKVCSSLDKTIIGCCSVGIFVFWTEGSFVRLFIAKKFYRFKNEKIKYLYAICKDTCIQWAVQYRISVVI